MTIRVAVWGPGSMGVIALRGVIDHPELELVDVVVHSDAKVGYDAGELCGIEAIGVIATNDPGAMLGVGEQVLGRWVRLQRQALSAGDTGAVLDADERVELERLRRENAELRLDREFLKKAAAFFVSEHNR